MSTATKTATPPLASGLRSVAIASTGFFATIPTPLRMKMWMAAVALSAVIAGVVTFGAIGDVSHAVQVIGYDTKPSVVLAMQIRAEMAELDAAATNQAITGLSGATVGVDADFVSASKDLNAKLLAAAGNVTFGVAETGPLLDIAKWLNLYQQEIGYIRGIGDTNPWLVRQRMAWASKLLREGALPAAEKLEVANNTPLEAAWKTFGSKVSFAEFELLAGLGLLGGALVGMQIYFARRTHRLISAPLASATILLAVGCLVAPYQIIVGKNAVQVAKESAFDSIYALYDIKANLYKMNADESLWLMDIDGGRSVSERSFAASAKMVFDTTDPLHAHLAPQFKSLAASAMEQERAGNPAEAQRRTPQFDGLLGKAISNITFGINERQAATDSVNAFIDYMAIDKTIRDLERQGKHRAAIDLCVGNAEGQSNWAFSRLIAAVDRTIAENEAPFEAQISKASRMLRWMPWAMGVGLGLIVLLSAVGAWLRIKDYR